MRNETRGDVWKVWIYAAAVVALGAWVSPLLYNAGKVLAEVSSNKTTNGLLEWLADRSRVMDFAAFFKASLLLAALALFYPWMEWIHAKRADAPVKGGNPWLIRLPDGTRMIGWGQPLQANLRGMWHGCAGFLLVSGLLLPMGMAVVPAGTLTLRHPGEPMIELALAVLLGAIAPAVVMEAVFRGIAMGIFLRAMRPAAAMAMTTVFFAVVLSVIPPAGLHVADPDATGIGFEMLRLIIGRYLDWRNILDVFLPLLALGFVLAYARWRTASLWLPVGLHTGWLFANELLAELSMAAESGRPSLSGDVLRSGIAPLIAIIVAGVFAHFLTSSHGDENAARP